MSYLKITGFTETTSAGVAFTMNSNYGLTQSLQGHHIASVIPEILLQMEYKDGHFIVSKNEVDLKGNLYPVNGWKELDHKIDNVLLEDEESVYYDIWGHQINKPSSKGVYIKNGTKRIIK